MKQKRFSDEQIIGILKEADAGAVVLDLCRKHGMSSALGALAAEQAFQHCGGGHIESLSGGLFGAASADSGHNHTPRPVPAYRQTNLKVVL